LDALLGVLIQFDVSNTSYYIEVVNGALLRDVTQSWKMILGGHGKVIGKYLGKSVGTPMYMMGVVDLLNGQVYDVKW